MVIVLVFAIQIGYQLSLDCAVITSIHDIMGWNWEAYNLSFLPIANSPILRLGLANFAGSMTKAIMKSGSVESLGKQFFGPGSQSMSSTDIAKHGILSCF
jgi:hypothetical protein